MKVFAHPLSMNLYCKGIFAHHILLPAGMLFDIAHLLDNLILGNQSLGMKVLELLEFLFLISFILDRLFELKVLDAFAVQVLPRS